MNSYGSTVIILAVIMVSLVALAMADLKGVRTGLSARDTAKRTGKSRTKDPVPKTKPAAADPKILKNGTNCN